MRQAVTLAALLILLTGCNSTRLNWLKPDPAKGVRPTNTPSVESLVTYLNDNAGRVQSIRSDDLRVTCALGLQQLDLSKGVLLTQKPRNFRMKGFVAGSEIADIGSNNDEFWFWGSKINPPAQLYCAYKDMAQARNMPLPFQPEWIMESLGMGPYGPASRYQPLEVKGDTYRLVEKTTSPRGEPVHKVIVMKAWEVKPPTPQIMAFLLEDDRTGQEICSAHIEETQIDSVTGTILPKRMELRWPAERITLRLQLRDVSVNAEMQPVAFIRPRLTGVDSYNLATGQKDSSIAPVRGVSP